jgi:hypothetical protein
LVWRFIAALKYRALFLPFALSRPVIGRKAERALARGLMGRLGLRVACRKPGGEYVWDCAPPRKPKGMHWSTYSRLNAHFQALADLVHRLELRAMCRFVR